MRLHLSLPTYFRHLESNPYRTFFLLDNACDTGIVSGTLYFVSAAKGSLDRAAI